MKTIVYLYNVAEEEGDADLRLALETYDPEEVCVEDVIIKIIRRGDLVTTKNMRDADKKCVSMGLVGLLKRSKVDQFNLLWNIHNCMDPDEVDSYLSDIISRLNRVEIK